MANLGHMLEALREERKHLLQEVSRIDGAINAVARLSGHAPAGRGLGVRKRRKVSAATRRKIAAAQRARWARIRKEKGA